MWIIIVKEGEQYIFSSVMIISLLNKPAPFIQQRNTKEIGINPPLDQHPFNSS